MELISREEAMEAIRAIKEAMLTNAEVINALFHVPTIIDTNTAFAIGNGSKEDRPTGKWTDAGAYYKCSICEDNLSLEPIKTNYCPHCGAKMEVEKWI